MSKRKPKELCCGTRNWRLWPVQEALRGMPRRLRRSRKVFHVREDGAVFWHWYDQGLRLAPGYGRGR